MLLRDGLRRMMRAGGSPTPPAPTPPLPPPSEFDAEDSGDTVTPLEGLRSPVGGAGLRLIGCIGERGDKDADGAALPCWSSSAPSTILGRRRLPASIAPNALARCCCCKRRPRSGMLGCFDTGRRSLATTPPYAQCTDWSAWSTSST